MPEKRREPAVVLVVILTIALGIILLVYTRPFGTQDRADGSQDSSFRGNESTTPHATNDFNALGPHLEWERPRPAPDIIRDPMLLDTPKGELLPKEGLANAGSDANIVGGTLVRLGESGPVFWVRGIVFSAENPSSVIIEDQILHEGEVIFGATIAKITEHTVVFEKDGKSWIVEVGQKSD